MGEDAVEQPNWRMRMSAILEGLNASDVGLLITVDEVRADLDELIQLVSVHQHFIREGRKVALLLAGLPARCLRYFRIDRFLFSDAHVNIISAA